MIKKMSQRTMTNDELDDIDSESSDSVSYKGDAIVNKNSDD